MNTAKAVIMAMIVALAMIGMTGFAMASSQHTTPSVTTVSYVGSGDYSADFDGRAGDVTIKTWTPEGYDRLVMTADCDYIGSQDMTSNSGWTEIERDVEAGKYPTITTYTNDNEGDYIKTGVSSRGQASLIQYVVIADDQSIMEYTGDGIVAFTAIDAYGKDREYAYVTTSTGDAGTRVKITADGGRLELTTLAAVGTDPSVGSATGQYIFDMDAFGKHGYGWNEGVADIEVWGTTEVGFDIETEYDATRHYADSFDTDGTLYGDGTPQSAVLDLKVMFDRNFDGDGYIYAISLN